MISTDQSVAGSVAFLHQYTTRSEPLTHTVASTSNSHHESNSTHNSLASVTTRRTNAEQGPQLFTAAFHRNDLPLSPTSIISGSLHRMSSSSAALHTHSDGAWRQQHRSSDSAAASSSFLLRRNREDGTRIYTADESMHNHHHGGDQNFVGEGSGGDSRGGEWRTGGGGGGLLLADQHCDYPHRHFDATATDSRDEGVNGNRYDTSAAHGAGSTERRSASFVPRIRRSSSRGGGLDGSIAGKCRPWRSRLGASPTADITRPWQSPRSSSGSFLDQQQQQQPHMFNTSVKSGTSGGSGFMASNVHTTLDSSNSGETSGRWGGASPSLQHGGRSQRSADAYVTVLDNRDRTPGRRPLSSSSSSPIANAAAAQIHAMKPPLPLSEMSGKHKGGEYYHHETNSSKSWVGNNGRGEGGGGGRNREEDSGIGRQRERNAFRSKEVVRGGRMESPRRAAPPVPSGDNDEEGRAYANANRSPPSTASLNSPRRGNGNAGSSSGKKRRSPAREGEENGSSGHTFHTPMAALGTLEDRYHANLRNIAIYLKNHYAQEDGEEGKGLETMLPDDISGLARCFQLEVYEYVRDARLQCGLDVSMFSPGGPSEGVGGVSEGDDDEEEEDCYGEDICVEGSSGSGGGNNNDVAATGRDDYYNRQTPVSRKRRGGGHDGFSTPPPAAAEQQYRAAASPLTSGPASSSRRGNTFPPGQQHLASSGLLQFPQQNQQLQKQKQQRSQQIVIQAVLPPLHNSSSPPHATSPAKAAAAAAICSPGGTRRMPPQMQERVLAGSPSAPYKHHVPLSSPPPASVTIGGSLSPPLPPRTGSPPPGILRVPTMSPQEQQEFWERRAHGLTTSSSPGGHLSPQLQQQRRPSIAISVPSSSAVLATSTIQNKVSPSRSAITANTSATPSLLLHLPSGTGRSSGDRGSKGPPVRKRPLKELMPLLRSGSFLLKFISAARAPHLRWFQVRDCIDVYRGKSALMPHLTWGSPDMHRRAQQEGGGGEYDGDDDVDPNCALNLMHLRAVHVGAGRGPNDPHAKLFKRSKGCVVDHHFNAMPSCMCAMLVFTTRTLGVGFLSEEERQTWVSGLMAVVERNRSLGL